jgi:hypothetical protein
MKTNTPQVRLDGASFKLVEDWRRAQPKIPARSDAVRQLLSLGLEASRHTGLVPSDGDAPTISTP